MKRAPAKFEFDILQFLDEHGPLTVREIYEQFGVPMGYIRGTIVKAMDRLLKKQLVSRELVAGSYTYSSLLSSEDLEQVLVKAFIDDRLQGRIKPIANYLSESANLTPDEVKLLDSLIKRLEP